VFVCKYDLGLFSFVNITVDIFFTNSAKAFCLFRNALKSETYILKLSKSDRSCVSVCKKYFVLIS
jgi:hypothetical protein